MAVTVDVVVAVVVSVAVAVGKGISVVGASVVGAPVVPVSWKVGLKTGSESPCMRASW